MAAGAGATAARFRARRGWRVQPDREYPDAGRWSAGSMVHTPRWSIRTHPSTQGVKTWRGTWLQSCARSGRRRYPPWQSTTRTCRRIEASRSRRWTRTTRENIERCRSLEGFEFDLDAAAQVWGDAMKLPGVADRPTPRWYHGDLAAENLLVRDGALTAVLDFGACRSATPPSTSSWPGRFSIPPPGSCSTAGRRRRRDLAARPGVGTLHHTDDLVLLDDHAGETRQVHGRGSQRPGRRGLSGLKRRL